MNERVKQPTTPAERGRQLTLLASLGMETAIQLNRFKCRYSLESDGFTRREAAHLVFHFWRTHVPGPTNGYTKIVEEVL